MLFLESFQTMFCLFAFGSAGNQSRGLTHAGQVTLPLSSVYPQAIRSVLFIR